MNQMIPRIGAGIVTAAVFLFAIFLLIDFSFGSYLVCMFLPIGYIMMTAGFYCESDEEHKVAASVGMVFSAVYAVLIFLVYFAVQFHLRMPQMKPPHIPTAILRHFDQPCLLMFLVLKPPRPFQIFADRILHRVLCVRIIAQHDHTDTVEHGAILPHYFFYRHKRFAFPCFWTSLFVTRCNI